MISAAVEGIVDEAVVTKLIAHVGGELGTTYGKHGKPALRERVAGYNNAARFAPWILVVDLDNEADCAPELKAQWVPAPSESLCFRVAVRQIEAWLIGDHETLASYLRVARSRVPRDPETLPNSKQCMVNIARHSRQRAVRDDMVPREGSGRSVGPAYASRLIEYATNFWRPAEAAMRCDSLSRAIACATRLVELVG